MPGCSLCHLVNITDLKENLFIQKPNFWFIPELADDLWQYGFIVYRLVSGKTLGICQISIKCPWRALGQIGGPPSRV